MNPLIGIRNCEVAVGLFRSTEKALGNSNLQLGILLALVSNAFIRVYLESYQDKLKKFLLGWFKILTSDRQKLMQISLHVWYSKARKN